MKPTILFSTGRCALGMVLVAQNDRGVCAILLGDDPRRLERDLAACFPDASLQEADSRLIEKVVSFIERPGDALDLDLDLQGSEFEQRVWRALQAIPASSTVAYGELAVRIGAPRAAKELGEACAADRLAARKRALLELEKGPP